MRAKSITWMAVSYGSGALAMLATRRLMALAWTQARTGAPPDGPAAVRAPVADAISWAVATGAGVGVARILAIRSAARVWEATVHEPPPGIEA
jgi:hypothetical protein